MDRLHPELRRRCNGDAGTAVVELALIIVPLAMILFGIIVYGYLMSFRQNMTAAAAEGARAGAVALPNAGYTTAIARATAATNKALGSFGQSCDGAKMGCAFDVQAAGIGVCASSPVPCIKVTVTYFYTDHPLLPDVPIVSSFLPSTFVSSSSAQLNT